MPVTYEKCGEDVQEIVRRIMEKYHGELVDAELNVGCLFARSDDDNPAVKVGGYPCVAKVRKTSLKDRAHGMPDAEIVIDTSWWNEATDKERDAVIDHELHHLELKRNDKNDPEYDDLRRPKLKLRLHDYQVGVFKSIIDRHGQNSQDAQLVTRMTDGLGQLLLFGEAQTSSKAKHTKLAVA